MLGHNQHYTLMQSVYADVDGETYNITADEIEKDYKN